MVTMRRNQRQKIAIPDSRSGRTARQDEGALGAENPLVPCALDVVPWTLCLGRCALCLGRFALGKCSTPARVTCVVAVAE